MHPPIGGGVSTDFKSSNRIKISWLVQILLHFYWFGAPHPPWGGGGWVGCVSEGLGMMWGLSRWCGDDMGMTGTMWGWQGRCGEDGDDMGTTGTTCGDHEDNMWRPQTMGTTWGPSEGYGDDVGMMGTMWGWRGQHGDNGNHEITKTAITFEWIEIIEFRLKIWDPWTLLPTCGLHLMCRWGVSYPKWHFYPKSAPVTLGNKIFLFFHWIPLDHI